MGCVGVSPTRMAKFSQPTWLEGEAVMERRHLACKMVSVSPTEEAKKSATVRTPLIQREGPQEGCHEGTLHVEAEERSGELSQPVGYKELIRHPPMAVYL